MRRSKSEIFIHAVWATQKREALITKELKPLLFSFIEMQAYHLRCRILALNGMPDHVHLIVRVPTTVCASQLAKQIKGTSSAYLNDLTDRTPYFRWQEGSGTFSLCEPILSQAIRYVENQEQHHAIDSLWPELEETDEEVPPRAEDWLILPSEGRLS